MKLVTVGFFVEEGIRKISDHSLFAAQCIITTST